MRTEFNETIYEGWIIDDGYSKNYDLYKYGTIILFVSCVMALVAIHFICPLRWNRNKIIKTLSNMKQRTQRSAKKKRRNFFDTRSISANTEFDFQPVATSDGPYPTSILRAESSSNKKASPLNTPDDYKGFPLRQIKKQPSQRSILINQPTALPSLPPETQSSFNAFHGNIMSSSRGQLFKDQHRRPSMVTFQMDGKSKQNRFNTIAHKPRQRVGLDLNFHSQGTNKANNNHQRFNYFTDLEQFPPHSALTKKYSSSQDLTNSSITGLDLTSDMNRIKKLRFSNCASSVPDFHKQGLVVDGARHQTALQDAYHNNRESDADSRSHRTKEEVTDEGQMQCVFEFDIERLKLKIKDLQVQTMFPPGVPGFVVEVMLEPRARTEEIARSKVYVTVDQQVEIQLEEIFQISCSKEQLMQCSIIISVIPILGNMVFVVETGLNELNLIGNGEIFLGGFFKGIYSQTF
ncbi:uncharacterized protein [Clytia hemisphaerica]